MVYKAAAGGGAPTDADYLVGTANGPLSAEIAVGTSPGGELGGTWASPTVDATHSGSAHHTRSHAVTGASDHTAGNHKLFYSDGAGAVQELAHGATSGHVLTSNGASSAPSWQAAAGGGGYTVVNHSSSTSLNAKDFARASGTITLSLPNSPAAGTPMGISNVGTGLVTVDRAGSDTIYAGASGLTSIVLQPGETVELLYYQTGTEWIAYPSSAFSTQWLMLTGDYTLTSSTSAQKAFNTTTNGTLAIPTGVYEFQALLYLTTMSGTSGNLAFGVLGGGTATLDRYGWKVVGIDNTSPLNAGTQTGSASVTATGPASNVTAGTGTGFHGLYSGMFRCTAAGTIIPSVTLVTAAAAVMKAGSWFRITRLGDTGQTYNGAWT